MQRRFTTTTTTSAPLRRLVRLAPWGLLALLLLSMIPKGVFPSRKLKNHQFSRGETLTYNVSYSFLDAGEAVVHLDEQVHPLSGRTCYKVDVDGRTTGVVGVTFKLRDKWQSYFDTATLLPLRFYRDIQEGQYRLTETSDFDHAARKVRVQAYKAHRNERREDVYPLPEYAMDMISGYYFLRTLDFSRMSKGDTIRMNAFFDDKSYVFQLIYLGQETTRTKLGRLPAFIISPIMPENKLFRGRHPLRIWISDDANRVPVKIEAEMFVGKVKVDLVKAQGLKKPLGKG